MKIICDFNKENNALIYLNSNISPHITFIEPGCAFLSPEHKASLYLLISIVRRSYHGYT